MNSMYRWLVVASMVVVGYGLTACELSEDCDPAVDFDCEVDDGGSPDTGGDVTVDTGPTFQTYHYVLIQDLENPATSSPTSTAGADIDSVELVQNGGSSFFADQVHACNFGSGDNDAARNCQFATGAPGSGAGNCSPSSPDFVSLGGNDGGELIVSFPGLAEIQQGDQVTVYECGAQQNPGATEEDFRISVGVSNAVNGFWEVCAPTATGIFSCTVPQLEQRPIN